MSLAVRLRIRSADDTADALVISTLASDAHPYVLELPSGDGQSFDPLDGSVTTGAFTIQVIDAVEGAARVVTAQLADADGRQQLLSRRAYIEQSTDGGVTWLVLVAGFVNAIRLVEPVVYEVAVGETRRVEVSTKVWATTSPGFNLATCRIGGPVVGGFGVQADHGPTQWVVDLVGTVADDAGRTLVRLRHVAGYWPDAQDHPDWTFIRGALPSYARDRANAGLSTAQATAHPLDLAFGLLQGVQAIDGMDVLVRVSGTSGAYVTMTAGATIDLFSGAVSLIGPSDRLVLWWDPALLALPALGQSFDLYAQPTDISESNPLHIDMHPVDIFTTMWDEAGEVYDATAASSVRAALGANRRWKIRVTESKVMADVEKMINGPEGLATRRDDQGRLVLFSTRIKTDTLPALTWTNDDLRDADGTVWDLDEQTVANKVTVKGQRFVKWTPDAPETRPMDDILMVPQTRGADNGDTSTFGTREIIYEIPGTIATDASSDGDLLAVAVAAAQQIFDRYGRGAIAGDVHVLASATQVNVGDEVILNLPQLPNRTTRGGPRCLQAVQKTPVLGAGFDYHLIDSGSTAQTATQPTFTLAKDADDPRHVAIVSLTNVAAIAAAGAAFGIALQWAMQATAPIGDGMALWSGNASVMQTLGLSDDVRTPAVQAGSKIWVRARTTSYQQRPSAWTAWQSVTLDAITAPSGLTATPVAGDSTAYDLAWTAGATDIAPVVQLRLASETTSRDIHRLPAGSTTYRLRGLDTGTAYVATVLYRASTAQGDVSAAVTVPFTTGGSAPTLAAPTDPVGVVGRPSNPFAIPGVQLTGYSTLILDGTYGLDVTSTELLGAVVFEVATETAIGSNTPGTYGEVDRRPPVITGRTTWRGTAPNDGLARFVRAKVVRDGATDSAYCAAQKVFPWSTAQRPEDVKIAAPAFAITYASRASDAGPQLVARITFAKPTSPYYLHTTFIITPPTGGAFTREAVDGSTPLEFPMAWGANYTVTATAVTTSGAPGSPSAPQTASFALFPYPGVPKGTPIYDPGVLDPATGAPPIARVVQGDPTDSEGKALLATVTQTSGGQQRVLSRGYIEGRDVHGAHISFAQTFQAIPAVDVFPVLFLEPRPKFNANGDGTGTTAPDPSLPQYVEAEAKNPTAEGFDLSVRLRQDSGTPTSHHAVFGAPTTITAEGASTDAPLTDGPASSDQYTVEYHPVLYATSGDGAGGDGFGNVSLTVELDTVQGGIPIPRYTHTFSYTTSTDFRGVNETKDFGHQFIVISASGLVNGDSIRVRILTVTSNNGLGHVDVTGEDVSYFIATSIYASGTPGATDRCKWTAKEVANV